MLVKFVLLSYSAYEIYFFVVFPETKGQEAFAVLFDESLVVV